MPAPVSHDNYKSAVLHEDDIEAKYTEERELGMTRGPYGGVSK